MAPDIKRRRLAVAVLAGVPAALILLGVVIERQGLFARLRFAIQRSPASMPSSTLVPLAEIAKGQPVVSVALPEADLRDDARGILANKMERGREWERAATVSYFDGGELLFASGVGLRVHGDGSRYTSRRQSFRLYFRRSYGADQFAPGLLFGEDSQPLRRLIIHNDERWATFENRSFWRFVNPLAYDIAARLGAIVADTKPAQFYLNGRYQGPYVLTEHFDEFYFRSHYGHDRFSVDPTEIDELREWIDAQHPMTTATARQEIDVDNLTQWFLAVLFCATTDAFQGPGQFRDETRSIGSWIFVNWDMDSSFREPAHNTYLRLLDQPNRRRQGRRLNEPRATVMTRLLYEDPAYREYYKRRVDEMLNYQLTPAFLMERADHYAGLAAAFEVKDRQYERAIRAFLTRRPTHVRELTETLLETGRSRRLQVAGPRITLDGFPVGNGFEGKYFPGRTVVAEADPGDRGRFVRWTVDGVAAGNDPRLTLVMNRDVRLQAVLR